MKTDSIENDITLNDQIGNDSIKNDGTKNESIKRQVKNMTKIDLIWNDTIKRDIIVIEGPEIDMIRIDLMSNESIY